MSKYENLKFNIKTKINKETDEYKTYLEVKGDYFDNLMFAIEAITKCCIEDFNMTKKYFVDSMKRTYEIVEENK